MTPRQLIKEAQRLGWLILQDSGKVLVELPKGHRELLEELKANKEQVRAILLKHKNTGRKRKKAKPAPDPLIPDSVPVTVPCRCSEHPFPHIHPPETVAGYVAAWPYVTGQPVRRRIVKAESLEALFEYVRQQIARNLPENVRMQRTAKQNARHSARQDLCNR
jgi:hypothetical protein